MVLRGNSQAHLLVLSLVGQIFVWLPWIDWHKKIYGCLTFYCRATAIGTNAVQLASKDGVFNSSEHLQLTEMRAIGALSRMARSSTAKHFCQLELQGTIENRSLPAGVLHSLMFEWWSPADLWIFSAGLACRQRNPNNLKCIFTVGQLKGTVTQNIFSLKTSPIGCIYLRNDSGLKKLP